MRRRPILFLSLCANLILAGALLVTQFKRRPPVAPLPLPTIKTNVVLRREFFSWQQVESTDYPTYISNLRDIGCPEQTIRDIIIADVNALYAKRLATEVVTPDQQWWRSSPDPEVVRAAAEKARALDNERRALLTRLLGTNWETGDLVSLPRPSRHTVVLDGSVLGALPPETKKTIEDIAARAEDRLQAYIQAQRSAGKEPDRAELARLRRQTRQELAGVLSPLQLEEYLLRYSQDANDLRTELGELKYFNASPDEFRAMFRSVDSIDQQIELLAGSTDANSNAQRDLLEQQRENALKTALGTDRYALYRLLHDPLYQQAAATALQAGDLSTAPALYQINIATADEQEKIRNNTNLTPAQMQIELKRVELEQLRAISQATGQELPPEPAPNPPPTTSHSVVMGETLYSIAASYGVPAVSIRLANPGFDFSKMKVGDQILVPLPSAPSQ